MGSDFATNNSFTYIEWYAHIDKAICRVPSMDIRMKPLSVRYTIGTKDNQTRGQITPLCGSKITLFDDNEGKFALIYFESGVMVMSRLSGNGAIGAKLQIMCADSKTPEDVEPDKIIHDLDFDAPFAFFTYGDGCVCPEHKLHISED